MAFDAATETLTTLTDCPTASVPLTRFRELFGTHPRLTALFLMAAQAERVALMDALTALGRMEGLERLVAFLLDLHDRLARIGAVRDGSFEVPMSQVQMAEKLGLSTVHMNRTLRALDAKGLVTRSGRVFHLNDIAALRRISQPPQRTLRFNAEWMPEGER